MRKELGTLFALGCTVATLLMGGPAGSQQQPTYQGRSLEEWLHLLVIEQTQGTGCDGSAHRAIREIGTSAIPFLLEWIAYDQEYDPTDPGRYSASIRRGYELAGNAEYGFWVLGPASAPALPALSNIVVTSKHSEGRAILAMARIGPAALPYLLTVLTNGSSNARPQAAMAVTSLGTNALPALPALIQSLTNSVTSKHAMASLLWLHRDLQLDPQMTVPALTNAATVYPPARARAILILPLFQDETRLALPFLLRSLDDPDKNVRDLATDALKRIAAEVLTNAPAR